MARTGTAIILALLWATMLLTGGPQSAFDTILMGLVYVGGHATLTAVAIAVTQLGGFQVLNALALVALVILVVQRRYRAAALLLFLVAMARLAVELQKLAIDRLRPDLHDLLVPVTSSSFPSAHAANSTVTYLAIALLLGRRPLWIAGAAALALVIGISRVMLGVHWPSDVIGGWSFALLWLAAWAPLIRNASPSSFIEAVKENEMSDNKRADSARDHDDSDLIDSMQDAPSQGGASGGNLQRDIASRAEEQHEVDGKPGITRVRDQDKPDEADLPRFNER